MIMVYFKTRENQKDVCYLLMAYPEYLKFQEEIKDKKEGSIIAVSECFI